MLLLTLDTLNMKKITLLICLVTVFFVANSSAQVYQAAVGVGLDFGEGTTLVGPSGKYFFTENHAGMAEVLFGDGVTAINLLYQYHGQFSGAEGLQWFAGGGPSFLLGSGNSDIGIRPMVGLDYKLTNVPLSFSFDWRPYISFDSGGSEFARFGLGFRYAFE